MKDWWITWKTAEWFVWMIILTNKNFTRCLVFFIIYKTLLISSAIGWSFFSDEIKGLKKKKDSSIVDCLGHCHCETLFFTCWTWRKTAQLQNISELSSFTKKLYNNSLCTILKHRENYFWLLKKLIFLIAVDKYSFVFATKELCWTLKIENFLRSTILKNCKSLISWV